MIAEMVIGLHLASLHSPSPWKLSGENPGLYLKTEEGWTAGGYRNSYGRLSLYAGKTFETEDKRWALTVGGISGYQRISGPAACGENEVNTRSHICQRPGTKGAIGPLVIPSVRLGDDNLALRISYAPKVEKRSAHALHFSLEWKI